MNSNEFVKEQLDILLENLKNKTLGEADKKGIFASKGKHEKVTGIAGDVIEQSYLGLPANTRQEPDIIVDGVPTELKTTGIRYSKKAEGLFEGKEPMSITAVSPDRIIYEEFEQSKFWEKLNHTLLVFYHYDSETPVKASEYADFIIKGYLFHEFRESEKKQLKADWERVRDYIRDLHTLYENPQEYYPSISSALRKDLMYLDTAPKWPNNPRFRLKRGVVTSIVQDYLGSNFEHLDTEIDSLDDIDRLCLNISKKYKGMTVKTLMDKLDVKGKLDKELCEKIAVAMFGAKSSRITNIDIFNKINLVGKTITLTKKGSRTEDTKFIPINFDEWTNKDLSYEESEVYDYFANNQFLMIIFEEPSESAKLEENVFLGFKRIVFDEKFILDDLKKTWEEVRRLVINKELKEEIVCYKKTGLPVINKKYGTYKTSINFPKSRYYNVFLRGTGSTSLLKHKTEKVNGIQMYIQYVWIKGKMMAELIDLKNSNDIL